MATNDLKEAEQKASPIDEHYNDAMQGGRGSKDGNVPPEQLQDMENNPDGSAGKADSGTGTGNSSGFYRGKDGKSYGHKNARFGFIRLQRRKRGIVALATGGVVGLVLSFFTFVPHFKIPSIMGDINAGIPSSIILRMSTEYALKRVLTSYLIAKADGNIHRSAKPDSQLGRFYTTLDQINAADTVQKNTGVTFAKVDGKVHAFFKGEKLGPASNYREVRALERLHPDTFGKNFGPMAFKTFPGVSLLYGTTFSNWWRVMTDGTFGTNYDRDKSRQENWKNHEKREAQFIYEEADENLERVLKCLLESEALCPADRNIQPVDTNNPDTAVAPDIGSIPDVDNNSVDAAVDGVQQGVDGALADGPAQGSYRQRLFDRLVGIFLNAAEKKAVAATIPVVGWINTAAQIDHALYAAGQRHLLTLTPTLIKEGQYIKVAGLWMGYADEIKEGSMHWSFEVGLAERLSGYDLGAAGRVLYGGDPRGALPVSPKVGSAPSAYLEASVGLDYVLGCTDQPNENQQLKIVAEYLRFTRCNSHALLDVWYKFVSVPLGYLGELGAAGVYWLWEDSLAQRALSALMVNIFGENWQERLVKFAVTALLELAGITIDPSAIEAELGNNIITGSEAMNYSYLQTNLGAHETSAGVQAELLRLADAYNQQRMASLSLGERLFSFEQPKSLASRLAIAAPVSRDPSVVVASILRPIQSLPSTFAALLSGRGLAASPTAEQMSAVTGIAPMGYTVEEVDADIAPEVFEQADPQCPPNQPGVYNNCQRYKEIINAMMCLDPACAAFPKQ